MVWINKKKYQCTPPLLPPPPPNARATGYASAIAKASGSANASGSASANAIGSDFTWGRSIILWLSQKILENNAYKNINSAKNVEFQLTTNEVAKINRINLYNILNIWFNMSYCELRIDWWRCVKSMPLLYRSVSIRRKMPWHT